MAGRGRLVRDAGTRGAGAARFGGDTVRCAGWALAGARPETSCDVPCDGEGCLAGDVLRPCNDLSMTFFPVVDVSKAVDFVRSLVLSETAVRRPYGLRDGSSGSRGASLSASMRFDSLTAITWNLVPGGNSTSCSPKSRPL